MILYPLRHCSLKTDLKSAKSSHAYTAVTACNAACTEKSVPNKLSLQTHSPVRNSKNNISLQSLLRSRSDRLPS